MKMLSVLPFLRYDSLELNEAKTPVRLLWYCYTLLKNRIVPFYFTEFKKKKIKCSKTILITDYNLQVWLKIIKILSQTFWHRLDVTADIIWIWSALIPWSHFYAQSLCRFYKKYYKWTNVGVFFTIISIKRNYNHIMKTTGLTSAIPLITWCFGCEWLTALTGVYTSGLNSFIL